MGEEISPSDAPVVFVAQSDATFELVTPVVHDLRARGVPVAHLEFAGEQHGWRRAETIVAAQEAELGFYGRVFGFRPADSVPDLAIRNLR
mgnify:CR=1 FL=1